MENLIIDDPLTHMGEVGLRLIGRQIDIGPYRIDLLFEDLSGQKIIVEIQRGKLDRDHTYRVIDYYYEYTETYPQEEVRCCIVANKIPDERKRRLRNWGVSFSEMPDFEVPDDYQAGRKHNPYTIEEFIESPSRRFPTPFRKRLRKKMPEEMLQLERRMLSRGIAPSRNYDQDGYINWVANFFGCSSSKLKDYTQEHPKVYLDIAVLWIHRYFAELDLEQDKKYLSAMQDVLSLLESGEWDDVSKNELIEKYLSDVRWGDGGSKSTHDSPTDGLT